MAKSKIDELFKKNYVNARRWFTVGELKEQLLRLTSVKKLDQIVTYRDYKLEDAWSMEMVMSGDRVSSLAMYEAGQHLCTWCR